MMYACCLGVEIVIFYDSYLVDCLISDEFYNGRIVTIVFASITFVLAIITQILISTQPG